MQIISGCDSNKYVKEEELELKLRKGPGSRRRVGRKVKVFLKNESSSGGVPDQRKKVVFR